MLIIGKLNFFSSLKGELNNRFFYAEKNCIKKIFSVLSFAMYLPPHERVGEFFLISRLIALISGFLRARTALSPVIHFAAFLYPPRVPTAREESQKYVGMRRVGLNNSSSSHPV